LNDTLVSIDLTALILRESLVSLTRPVLKMRTKKHVHAQPLKFQRMIGRFLVEGNTETFVGYDQTESEAKITRIRKVDSKKRGYVPNRFR
jgi:alanyl-tRNA synthetase